jgi:hypothetical protein
MDGPIRFLTTGLLMLPAVLLVLSFFSYTALAAPALFIGAIYLWVWLRFRPQRFEITVDSLRVIWPIGSRQIQRLEIYDVELITRAELREKIGWGLRIGAGGLWGGFGWLYTANRGLIRMYISRIDRVVWFETLPGTAWIITPDHPEEFIAALTH